MKQLTSEAFRNNPMFMRNQFLGDGLYNMPKIKRDIVDLADVSLIGYDQTKTGDSRDAGCYVHFFLDDYKFEVVWKNPEQTIEKLRQYKGVLSPQFSSFYSLPLPLQIYNIFRSRWCGAYLQSKGIKVIPSISWGLPQSYAFCFDGIEKGSIVAISTLGVKTEKEFFCKAIEKCLSGLNLKPLFVIVPYFQRWKEK